MYNTLKLLEADSSLVPVVVRGPSPFAQAASFGVKANDRTAPGPWLTVRVLRGVAHLFPRGAKARWVDLRANDPTAKGPQPTAKAPRPTAKAPSGVAKALGVDVNGR